MADASACDRERLFAHKQLQRFVQAEKKLFHIAYKKNARSRTMMTRTPVVVELGSEHAVERPKLAEDVPQAELDVSTLGRML